VKHAILKAPHNFEVHKTGEDKQMELLVLQYNCSKKMSDTSVQDF
jgi:hypothetical protein